MPLMLVLNHLHFKLFFTMRLLLSNLAFVLLLNLTCSPTYAQNFMSNPTGRNTTSLNGTWKVIIDWYNRGNQLKIYQDRKASKPTEFVEYSFKQPMQVPGDWNAQDPHLFMWEGTVWYKKEFTATPKTGKRTFIYFGAANYFTEVYLNGKKLGSHEGGFTPFQFEVTDALQDGTNKLVVSVNSQRKEESIPAMNYDWWNYGGITRDVSLIETPANFIEDYFIQLKKGSQNEVEAWVKVNGMNKSKKVNLSIPAVGINKVLETDTSGYARITFKADLKLWTPEVPKQYDITLATDEESVKEKIGFRSIEVKGLDILLNGKSVFLRGVNFHEEIAKEMRRATSDADARSILQSAKDLGCNFIRTAHYPQSENLVKMAEEMGLMIWEEIPLWQGIQFGNPIILAKAEFMLREMIRRDKNRASIIMWSISNETTPAADRDRGLTNMAATCRSLDPTRLVTSAFNHVKTDGNKTILEDTLSNVLDVVGINRYMGWYKAWPDKPGTMVFESKFTKPVIISEFGGEAKFGNHGTADSAGLWNEEYQEQLYKDNIAMFKNVSFLRGITPWVLYDFRSPTRMNAANQDGWNRKGLLSDKGEKKKAWYVLKAYYDSIK